MLFCFFFLPENGCIFFKCFSTISAKEWLMLHTLLDITRHKRQLDFKTHFTDSMLKCGPHALFSVPTFNNQWMGFCPMKLSDDGSKNL